MSSGTHGYGTNFSDIYYLITQFVSGNTESIRVSGVAHNAVSQIEVGGQSVMVLGAGPVGLFAVAISKALGIVEIINLSLKYIVKISLHN